MADQNSITQSADDHKSPGDSGFSPSRRCFVAGLASTPMAAAPAMASGSSELARLIAAHKIAYDAHSSALEQEDDALDAAEQDKYVLPIETRAMYGTSIEPWKMPKSEVLDQIARTYQSARNERRLLRLLTNDDEQITGHLAAIAAAEAEDVAEVEAAFDRYNNRPLQRAHIEAAAASARAGEAEDAAGKAILSFPCRSREELSQKVAYLMSENMWLEGLPTEDDLHLFLRSLLIGGEANA